MCVTTFSNKGYEEYGKKMIETFDQYWNKDIELLVFVDSPIDNLKSSRILQFPLTDYPEIQAFTNRHKDNPLAHGKQPFRAFFGSELVLVRTQDFAIKLYKRYQWNEFEMSQFVGIRIRSYHFDLMRKAR
ncbi:hypothetical protein LCGC14_1510330 [marine sediment metagenome]|uniref:Uncharacterized protein n=1 Tax=marine sediment metagenome TaxID=412755 RepID=A0A0F9LGZ8_9ZZZZ